MSGFSAIPKTMPELVAFACAAYGREPNDEILRSWKATLGHLPVRDVYGAFIAHQQDTRPDPRDGRPVGHWFPQPADLLAHVESKRRVQSVGYEYCGDPTCHCGFVNVPGDRYAVVRCPRCAALWAAGAPAR